MPEALLSKGKSATRKQTRARILRKAVGGCKDAAIMEALAVSATMVGNTRQRCVEEGVEAAWHDRPRPVKAPKLTDKQCAHVIATAGTPSPAGHDQKLRIAIVGEVAVVIDRVLGRPHKTTGQALVQNEAGQRITYGALRSRFDKAREAARVEFQFRDLRAKVATDVGDLAHAQGLLGHKTWAMT